MSRPATPGSATQPKQMSSRLMNLKFMQRASSTSNRSPNTANTPSSEPPTKRIRTESGTATPTRSASYSAREAQDAGRVPRLAREGEETAWVLKTAAPPVRSNVEDESDEDIWSQQTGRQTFGKFTRRKAQPQPSKPARDDADADLSSASEDEESDELDHYANMRSAASQAKKADFKIRDTMSPLRQQAMRQQQKDERNGKRKQSILGDGSRKKARKTM